MESPNEDIIEELQFYLKHHRKTGNTQLVEAYENAINSIRAHPNRITSGMAAQRLKFVGPTIGGNIERYLAKRREENPPTVEEILASRPRLPRTPRRDRRGYDLIIPSRRAMKKNPKPIKYRGPPLIDLTAETPPPSTKRRKRNEEEDEEEVVVVMARNYGILPLGLDKKAREKIAKYGPLNDMQDLLTRHLQKAFDDERTLISCVGELKNLIMNVFHFTRGQSERKELLERLKGIITQGIRTKEHLRSLIHHIFTAGMDKLCRITNPKQIESVKRMASMFMRAVVEAYQFHHQHLTGQPLERGLCNEETPECYLQNCVVLQGLLLDYGPNVIELTTSCILPFSGYDYKAELLSHGAVNDPAVKLRNNRTVTIGRRSWPSVRADETISRQIVQLTRKDNTVYVTSLRDVPVVKVNGEPLANGSTVVTKEGDIVSQLSLRFIITRTNEDDDTWSFEED